MFDLSVNAIAGDDLRSWWRVSHLWRLVHQFECAGVIEGDPGNEELYFLNTDGEGRIEVSDPCEAYDSEGRRRGECHCVCRDFGGGVPGYRIRGRRTHDLHCGVEHRWIRHRIGGEWIRGQPFFRNWGVLGSRDDQYGCHDATAFQVTTTDLVETPFGLEAPESLLQGMDKCPIRWERRVD